MSIKFYESPFHAIEEPEVASKSVLKANLLALAERIHAAILGEEILLGKLVSVVRPMK